MIKQELERMKFHMKRDTFKKVLDLETGNEINITDYVVKLESTAKTGENKNG